MIAFGTKAKDTLTGFSGTVIALVQYLNGCVSYQIQPETKHDGDTPPTEPTKKIWVDAHDLEADDDGKKVDSLFAIGFGDKAREKVTGFKGVITIRYAYANGSRRYAVQPTKLKKGYPQKDRIFDEQELMDKPKAKSGGPGDVHGGFDSHQI